jgi:Uma2 family endonuclease
MMHEQVEDEVYFSGDFCPMEEESMPETALHAELIQYLVQVLKWLFHGRLCAIHRNLAFYQAPERNAPPVAPDIAIIKGCPFQPINSWRVGTTGPAPHVVFEILSGETWKKDVEEKPAVYARMGVQEYFAYDPNLTPLTGTAAQRLFGWRLDQESQRIAPLILRPGGYLWSRELDSFLVPDEQLLRLYDRNSQVRLTEAEAEAAARQVAERRAEDEAVARRAAERQAEAEAAAKRAAEKRAEDEAAAKRAAERQAKALAEKLRSLGIDPDQV